ncbi:hypothetical protein VIGAN_06001100 [Vigna angularis var. angularis]|uniref:Uncharacterized protein n=1 Tax=Vigna angularis var. angularis TaxID=157739 RepID=A0A0S3S8F9_PHAAN|nr:hypothetical protein VIGAN_06001100 [Vigna angularis var. angularis]
MSFYLLRAAHHFSGPCAYFCFQPWAPSLLDAGPGSCCQFLSQHPLKSKLMLLDLEPSCRMRLNVVQCWTWTSKPLLDLLDGQVAAGPLLLSPMLDIIRVKAGRGPHAWSVKAGC